MQISKDFRPGMHLHGTNGTGPSPVNKEYPISNHNCSRVIHATEIDPGYNRNIYRKQGGREHFIYPLQEDAVLLLGFKWRIFQPKKKEENYLHQAITW